MHRLAGLLLAALVGVIAIPAQATPITFTFSSTDMSGTLNGVAFSNQTLTVTLTADTANVLNCNPVAPFIVYDTGCGAAGPAIPASFTLGGQTGTFDQLFYEFNNTGSDGLGIGIGGVETAYIAPFIGASVYDMVSSFGPVSAAGGVSFNGTGTSLGALTANGGESSSSVTTFSAVLGAIGVPEPGELGLFGLGLLGALGLGLRRRG